MAGDLSRAAALAGETLDALCWRVLGTTRGTVEQVMALNPAHASSVVLPAGATVLLPAIAAAEPVRETVQLWH